ncbi:MAG: RNA-binding cell elongation regulator Jag/EloR [Dehalococcoidia bacterium]|jgi:spoIIIJ-associated protein|nr:RNA-binding cell elongation regulator Jag/EloR [Dehalococcoidia bacterium]
MEPRRFSGKTVEEATDNALEKLDANLEDVEIVVVNPGRSGILGFGGEPAEIDVTVPGGGTAGRAYESGSEAESDDDEYARDSDGDYEADGSEAATASYPGDDDFATGSDSDGDDEEFEDEREEESVSVAEVEEEDEGGPEPVQPAARRGGGRRSREDRSERRERPSEPDPEVIEFASEVIDYFLASMNVVADTYIREETDDGVPVFDIEGEDSGLLIGRRGETLQSLQYLVNLIVTHQLGRSAYVQIDIEGYKERRRETLAGVAQRTAERVADSGESAELEPMPAYERRWVHMALANNSEVRTESSGEGSDRFVVIYPGRDGGGGASGPRGGNRPRGRGGRRGRR